MGMDHLFLELPVKRGGVTRTDVPTIMQDLWCRSHPDQPFPDVTLETVRRMLIRWRSSWRRAHKKRRPTVDQARAIAFVSSIEEPVPTAAPGDVINCDETAHVTYPEVYTWARRGADAIQKHVPGDEKQSDTVMVTVTMDGPKLPLFVIVKEKTPRSEKGLDLGRESPIVQLTASRGGRLQRQRYSG
jgi:hypothetical protein